MQYFEQIPLSCKHVINQWRNMWHFELKDLFQIVKMPSLSKTFLGYRNFKALIPIHFVKKIDFLNLMQRIYWPRGSVLRWMSIVWNREMQIMVLLHKTGVLSVYCWRGFVLDFLISLMCVCVWLEKKLLYCLFAYTNELNPLFLPCS